MVQIKLKRLIKKDLSPLLSSIFSAVGTPIGIQDVNGQLLMGDDSQAAQGRYPVELEGEMIGWVTGGEQAKPVVTLLVNLLNQALEKKTLANEILDKYREINLLYNIAQKLTACRQLPEMAKLALEEAKRLIRGTDASLMLHNEQTGHLELVMASEQKQASGSQIAVDEGITSWVASTGKAEIVNDVLADPRSRPGTHPVRSLLCAPLKDQEQVIGIITISSEEPVNYTAADLKLLTAIAMQAAPAIKNALFHEKQMEEARIRELQLKKQVMELRIEIDEVKRARKVAEITESEEFQNIKQKGRELRQRIKERRKSSNR
ncbi:MAG: GAF domain-containing protein [Xenococcaceae cyanobacterium]